MYASRSGVPVGFSKYSVPKLRERPYVYLVEIRATRFRFAQLMLRLNVIVLVWCRMYRAPYLLLFVVRESQLDRTLTLAARVLCVSKHISPQEVLLLGVPPAISIMPNFTGGGIRF